MTPEQIKDRIVKVLDEKKAKDIEVLCVREKTTIADYFIIATGSSNTQLKALTEYVEDAMEQENILVSRIEGLRDAKWIVMDYASVIVHIFSAETRENFNLEKLWQIERTLG